MSGQAERKWPLVGLTALLTAAVAFPAGLWLSSTRAPASEGLRDAESPLPRGAGAAAHGKAAVRNVYSARIASDPYVVAQQRAVVEAMERGCTHLCEDCAQAAQAKQYLDRVAAE